jgi:hypothetical protein
MSEMYRRNKKNVRISDDLYERTAHFAQKMRPKTTIRNIVEAALERYLDYLESSYNK